jgi:uncharacterized protein YnzC (UPF0291/DUF896 family)
MPAKIERSTSLPSTPRAPAVSRANAVTPAAPAQPVARARAAEAVFAGQAAATVSALTPAGQQVATSADPAALWGSPAPAPEASPPSVDAFRAMSPAAQTSTLESIRAERAQLGQEIEARVEQLDRKWRHSRLSTRTEALQHYEGASGRLPRGKRRELRAHVIQALEAQARIEELSARVAELPKTPEAKREQAALRAELAKELRRAREEQSKAVAAATAILDQEGLKVDRLAVTEQIIDPTAPAQGSGGSLLDKVLRFFFLDELMGSFLRALKDSMDAETRRTQARSEAQAEEQQARVRRRIEDERRLDEQRQAESTARAQLAPLLARLPPPVR